MGDKGLDKNGGGVIKKFAWIPGAWLFLGGLMLLFNLPRVPRTRVGLLLFIIIAPPFYVLGDGFFGWLFSDKHGRSISSRSFSVLRILAALTGTLLLVGLIVAIQFIVVQFAAPT